MSTDAPYKKKRTQLGLQITPELKKRIDDIVPFIREKHAEIFRELAGSLATGQCFSVRKILEAGLKQLEAERAIAAKADKQGSATRP